MRIRWNLVLAVLVLVFAAAAAPPWLSAQEGALHDRYLAYARAAADWTWEHRDELLARWREGFDPESVFGYRAPGGLLETAVIYAYLFEHEGGAEYAERVKQVLLTYGDYRSMFPDWAARQRPDYTDGVPALPDFFTVMRYVKAYDVLKRLSFLSPEESAKLEGLIAHSMDFLVRTAEWGPMNRTALRAESLAWAVRALPDHPRAPVWRMQMQALGDDNWGNWEIEDATIYHGVWLYALMGYADAVGKVDELFKTPEIYYYAHYFLNLMCPASMVPDFGDARWLDNWQHYLVFFEAASARYGDPALKWAAETIARKFVDFDRPTSIGLGYFLLDCHRWGGGGIRAETPKAGSMEVMEDVQGKKIVFRDGWAPDSTYMLLNYRDEGDGGLNFRDYLRDTIPVEEEKMTHGHADENGIVLLMSGGSVLLHDGGYRDYMPSGPFGAYRQDYFHNRLCVRPQKIWMGQRQGEYRYSIRDAVRGQGVLEFLRDAGSYRQIRTRKIDFISLPDFDYGRTRLIDDGWGYDWDRVVAWVKDPGLFVVFDIFKSRTEEFFTLAGLWHTRKIYAQGEHWYDTGYDAIGNFDLPDAERLLILFPQTHFRLEGVEGETRHYQEELVIHQTAAHHFELAETDYLVTVLIPHAKDRAPEELAGMVRFLESEPDRAAPAVQIESGGRSIIVGAKADLRMDMRRDWRRPRYTYESGRIKLGEIETNGDFVFAALEGGELSYTIVNLTKALYGDRVLHEGKSSFYGLAFDASPDAQGVGKARYWRDRVRVEAR